MAMHSQKVIFITPNEIKITSDKNYFSPYRIFFLSDVLMVTHFIITFFVVPSFIRMIFSPGLGVSIRLPSKE